ncbi:hypothetical protein [Bacillus sp. MUM 13]|uniref:hypothetical protein n=1 Tax=Bacillus sp. MUM 13 TaxID=1678001 RepID=UPI0008F5D9A8|nr:hypothetical protein [Bacillus sp. MUM 13]OIK08193.1 hypothetical protein BIV59_20600 [Bacillus sp. MUM 13]
MKKIVSVFLTVIAFLAVNYFVSTVAKGNFIDYSFIVGLLLTVMVKFFTSKGGVSAKMAEGYTQATTTERMEHNNKEYSFSPGAVFYTGIAYTGLSVLITVIHYRSYF